MEFALLMFIMLVIAPVIYMKQRARQEQIIQDALARHGLEATQISLGFSTSRHGEIRPFTFSAMRTETGERFMGKGMLRNGVPTFEWHGNNPLVKQVTLDEVEQRHQQHLEMLSPAERREQQIRQEVAQRLDRISANPQEMMRYDLDGSGHIDQREWDAVRQRIRAEVEADLGAQQPDRASVAPPPHPGGSSPDGTSW